MELFGNSHRIAALHGRHLKIGSGAVGLTKRLGAQGHALKPLSSMGNAGLLAQRLAYPIT